MIAGGDGIVLASGPVCALSQTGDLSGGAIAGYCLGNKADLHDRQGFDARKTYK
ncbi:MAG: hypothetical protein AB4352_28065 [Hormoscilla sp.]